MQLAFLGTGPDAMALLRAAVQSSHQIVWLGEVQTEDAEEVSRLVPGIQPATDWEWLLDSELADAVVVGRGTASDDLRAEQLKRLATDARALLVVHPASSSVLTYYEVDMAGRESGAIVRHYNPIADHPAIADLTRWTQAGHEPIGQVVQVTCDRALATTSRRSVLGQFARDAEVLHAVTGGIRSTSAIGPRDLDGSYAALQIQMATGGELSARWSVVPAAAGNESATLTLVGEKGSVALLIPSNAAGPQTWEMRTTIDGASDVQQLTEWDAARAAIDSLDEFLTTTRIAEPSASTWEQATQAMEVADAAELSLQKGKSVEVHHQKLTEQLAFRGTMAALGCGVIMLGLAVLVVMTLLGGVESVLGQPLLPFWPLLLLGMLALFLLLQVVPLLASKRK